MPSKISILRLEMLTLSMYRLGITVYYTLFCNKCDNNFIINGALLKNRLHKHINICTICNPKYNFVSELEI